MKTVKEGKVTEGMTSELRVKGTWILSTIEVTNPQPSLSTLEIPTGDSSDKIHLASFPC
jgi:hypothetical protein